MVQSSFLEFKCVKSNPDFEQQFTTVVSPNIFSSDAITEQLMYSFNGQIGSNFYATKIAGKNHTIIGFYAGNQSPLNK